MKYNDVRVDGKETILMSALIRDKIMPGIFLR